MAYSDSSGSCVASVLKITICFEITIRVYIQNMSDIYVIMLFLKSVPVSVDKNMPI